MKDLVNDDVRLVAATIELTPMREATSSAELGSSRRRRAAALAGHPNTMMRKPAPGSKASFTTRPMMAGSATTSSPATTGPSTLAGIAGYTGEPDQSLVEIGYSIIPEPCSGEALPRKPLQRSAARPSPTRPSMP